MDYCTPALMHEEAIEAAQVKKTWNDDKLCVRTSEARSVESCAERSAGLCGFLLCDVSKDEDGAFGRGIPPRFIPTLIHRIKKLILNVDIMFEHFTNFPFDNRTFHVGK